jgi:hypothetical protein
MEQTMSEWQLEGARLATLGHDDLTRIFGEIDDTKIIEILALKPTLQELEEAAMWAAGNGDILAKEGHPLGPVAAAIVDILTAEEEQEPR